MKVLTVITKSGFCKETPIVEGPLEITVDHTELVKIFKERLGRDGWTYSNLVYFNPSEVAALVVIDYPEELEKQKKEAEDSYEIDSGPVF